MFDHGSLTHKTGTLKLTTLRDNKGLYDCRPRSAVSSGRILPAGFVPSPLLSRCRPVPRWYRGGSELEYALAKADDDKDGKGDQELGGASYMDARQ